MTPQELKQCTIADLRRLAQATAPQGGREPLVGYPVRFFSIYFSRVFVRTGITPNQINAASVVVFLVGIALFAFNDYTLNLLGTFIIFWSIVLDAADGEIARLKRFKTDVGVFYAEPVSHDIQYALTFIPLTLGAYAATGSVMIVYVGFIATIGKVLLRFITTRYTALLMKRAKDIMAESGEPGEPSIKFNPNVSSPHKIYRFIKRNILSSTGMPYPLLVFSLWNRIDLLIWFYAVAFVGLFVLNFVRQLPHVARMSGIQEDAAV